jgi:hypothetical protein
VSSNKWHLELGCGPGIIMSRSSDGARGSPSVRGDQSLSPPPRRPRHRDGRREVIVERVVEKSMAGIVYPMLTRMNYTEWSTVMRVNLQAAGL